VSVAPRLADLDGARVTVEVPATTANLGAGYDCLGLALDLVVRVSVEVRLAGPTSVAVTGEGEGEIGTDGDNRCLGGLEAAVRAVTGEPPDDLGWRIEMANRIPLARGLGASAAATVAGLVAGNELLGRPLPDRELLRIATEMEGHSDNAAPALLGGFVVSTPRDGQVEAVRFDVPRGLRAVVLIPELRLATADMRRVLPPSVPHADAVANLGRVAIGVAGLATGRRDLLRLLTEDRLHEPYRAAAYPQLPRLVADARAAGAIGACLSGSGSSVIAFTDTLAGVARIQAAFRAAAADTDLPARVEVVAPRGLGARVIAGS
jgi:homoserine kinase